MRNSSTTSQPTAMVVGALFQNLQKKLLSHHDHHHHHHFNVPSFSDHHHRIHFPTTTANPNEAAFFTFSANPSLILAATSQPDHHLHQQLYLPTTVNNNAIINPTAAVPPQGLFVDHSLHNHLPPPIISSTVVNDPSMSTNYDSTWLLGHQGSTTCPTTTTTTSTQFDQSSTTLMAAAPDTYDNNSFGGVGEKLMIDPGSILSAYESALMATASMMPKLCDISNVDGNFYLMPSAACSSSPQLADMPLNIDSMINMPSLPLTPSLSSSPGAQPCFKHDLISLSLPFVKGFPIAKIKMECVVPLLEAPRQTRTKIDEHTFRATIELLLYDGRNIRI
ncbi:hypothetical protein TIFTF001_006412 [Ficus carica]|uniref:Uncharacterized protein n=1 Tax=Ficus carica TaxID=3494 RepID=A0AA87ZP92_FICCA|nr:hypothetical protein TIFTF001_006412 [Ficus carica]